MQDSASCTLRSTPATSSWKSASSCLSSSCLCHRFSDSCDRNVFTTLNSTLPLVFKNIRKGRLTNLNQEEEESDVGGDRDGDVDLDCLDLLGGEHPGGHGDLAAVDGPEHGEEEEREDDVDADLDPEPELRVQLQQRLEHAEHDQDEADDHSEGSAHRQQQGQRVQESPENGAGGRGREKPGKYLIFRSKTKIVAS